jgi:hypothetical protein
MAYHANAVTLWRCLQQYVLAASIEIASSALTSSTLKWQHRIQCGFNIRLWQYFQPASSSVFSFPSPCLKLSTMHLLYTKHARSHKPGIPSWIPKYVYQWIGLSWQMSRGWYSGLILTSNTVRCWFLPQGRECALSRRFYVAGRDVLHA